jgi:two-component system, LuxR family, sensor histidine kinase DctS
MLVVLVVLLLAILVWLAGRYEVSQVQSRLERDATEATSDIRAALTRNVQSLQALHSGGTLDGGAAPQIWAQEAVAVLREHRELLRLEWRDSALATRAAADTPYRDAVFFRLGRESSQSEIAIACDVARRLSGPAYSSSYFVPQADGQGQEVMEMCLPLALAGKPSGYIVATYSLQNVLSELVGKQLLRGQEISFTEADGTRLALHGTTRRASRVFSAQQLLDLPGNTMVVRMDSWRAAPDLFPNVLTALVSLMSIALVSVLLLLSKDNSRRLKAERDLADALAFRKAMEDSLVTGLRARDLVGRITYVNPAFCQMTGYSATELVGATSPQPYWPPELVDEYQQRQAVRFAGQMPSRDGYESVFVRKDGTRFPVLIIEAPLINAQGMQTGWMGAVLDITDQRRMEELSRASQERLQASARLATVGEMASLLSHELNQPLAAISSYATGSINMLQSQATPPVSAAHDVMHAMRRIGEQAERAGKVIKSVHDFVRRRDHAHETVLPQTLFDAIMPLVSLQARKLGVRVQVQCAPALPGVVCDRTMVEQVLLNLARNATQAMEHVSLANRVLELRAAYAPLSAEHRDAHRWVEFSVADCGAGIDATTAEKLFTPFFTTKAEGMGLGLSLCRTVIEQHGGALAFAARAPQGTIFRFTLPTIRHAAHP